MHNLRVYLSLLELDLRARAEYRADFLLSILAALLQNGVTLSVLWLVFAQVRALGGWNLYQAALLYGLFALATALTNLLAGGLRDLAWFVRFGELDQFLVQPASAYVQMLPRAQAGPLGELAVAAAITIGAATQAGVAWSPASAGLILLAVLCGAGIFIGFMTAIYSLVFWVPYPQLMAGVEDLREFARYPSSVYPRWLRLLLSGIVPVAFAAHYPAALLTGVEQLPWYTPLLLPLAAAAMLGAGALAWNQGLKRYESTGS